MRKLLRRPSPAMVVACLALLVALGGTGMAAATQLARNSVGTPQLKDGAVTNAKIKNNAVNSAKVAARSLLRSDFAPGQLPAGPIGPQGPPARRGHRCCRRSRPCRCDRPGHRAAGLGQRPGIGLRQADAQHALGYADGQRELQLG